MANFFSKLFGFKEDSPSQRNELQHTPGESQKKSGRREPPKELDWSRAEQVPLPSSPPTWEVDGRNEFQNDYRDPVIGPVFRASFSGKHAAVVKLAAGLTAEQRKGKVGVEIAKAFRKLIVQRNKNSQLAAAAKLSLEMFATIPDDVEDVDRRRYNRILGQLDQDGKKHEFTPVEVSDQPAQPLFAITEALGWVLAGERKLKDDERPHQEFEIASVDSQGTWWLDSRGSSAGLPEVKCVIRRTDRQGNPVGEKALGHDAYRFGMGVAGSSIGIMDSNGGLHVYGPNLELVKEINLCDDLRVTEHFRTIDTNYWGDFKSQVRAIDVSSEGVSQHR